MAYLKILSQHSPDEVDTTKTSIRIASNPFKIQTGYLSHKYRFTALLLLDILFNSLKFIIYL